MDTDNASRSGFENFCGGPLWNTSLTWETESPQLTDCFRVTVLVWLPSTWLLVCISAYLAYLHQQKGPPTPRGKLHITKLVVSGLISCISLVLLILSLIKYTHNSQLTPLADVITPAITTLTLIVATITIHIERKSGITTSGFLFIFWLLTVLVDAIESYHVILQISETNLTHNVSYTVIFFVMFGLSILEFVLFCFAEWTHRETYLNRNVCPEKYSSFLSRITFSWIDGLIVRGYKKSLEEQDVWALDRNDRSISNIPTLETAWEAEKGRCKWSDHGVQIAAPLLRDSENQEVSEETPLILSSNRPESREGKRNKVPSLFRAMVKVYWFTLFRAHLCKLVCDGFTFLGPTLQRLLIGFTENREEEQWKGYLYAFSFFLLAVVNSFFFHQLFHIGLFLGMRVRSAVIGLIYKKALRLSNQARKETTVGEIVNLMSVDAQRLQDVTGYLWMVWSGPLQVAVAIWLLWGILGPSVLAGLAVMILLIPANVIIGSKQQKLQVAQMQQKDGRIKLMNELLNGIKVLKLYAWELAFADKVSSIRGEELASLRSYSLLAGVASFSWSMATFMVTLATFTTYVLLGNKLDAQTAFVSLSLFNILYFPINLLPLVISSVITASVSIRRVANFLRKEELDPECVSHDTSQDNPIEIENATFSWGKDERNTLEGINFSAEKGSLVAVVGNVGSGKSSLISATLGDMVKRKGNINLHGKVAYVPQQAWVQNATLRDNILFGKTYDAEKYNKVLQACALGPDIDILPGGDQTEIGEKGINLSGGQKQRISLARAVYNDASLYLLDDPLSAVDSHVGKHIFDNIIGENGLLRNKTRVLVTNALHFLPRVDKVVVLMGGYISETGSYDELLDHDGAFAQFLKNFLLNTTEDEIGDGQVDDDHLADDEETIEFKKDLLKRLESFQSDQSGPETSPEDTSMNKGKSLNSLSLPSKRKTEKAIHSVEDVVADASPKLVTEEEAGKGKVQWAVFITYAKALGSINTVVLLLAYILFQAASVVDNLWLTEWTNDPTPLNSTDYLAVRDYYLGIYGGLGIVQALFIMIYALTMAFSMIKASRTLHHAMLHHVLRAPMSFYDTTPSGRILNRFSRDMETVDNILPELIRSFMNSFFVVVAGIFVIAYSTPIFLAVLLPLVIIYYFLQRFYIPTSRQLKRLESTTRSPIFGHFSETISGANSIRAYRQEERFIDKSNDLVDYNLVYYISSMTSNRWLGFRLDLISAVIVLATALFAVLGRDSLTGGVVGLTISYALQCTSELNWIVRVTSDLESNIVSVERIKEYTDVPTEAEWDISETSPNASWPEEGAVSFQNYSTRYRQGMALVLNDISLSVKPKEKVGIVGRTGAGKSSLTMALFRIIEPAGGEIIIDGEGISQLGLHQLRSKITILPQDPVLFSGSLRFNVDPLLSHSDEDIWEAVQRAHLKDFVNTLSEGLNYECGEGGLNLSVGQRQLICLARALLHKSRLLVLDEATASVDLETDELIQATIRTEFAESTVLTIAHRLNTIMDYDRILVLDNGHVAEFDTPAALLADQQSLFYGMAREAGLSN